LGLECYTCTSINSCLSTENVQTRTCLTTSATCSTVSFASSLNFIRTVFVIRDCVPIDYCKNQNLTSAASISFGSASLSGLTSFTCNQCNTDKCNNEKVTINSSSSIKFVPYVILVNLIVLFYNVLFY
jgi:hypothetical protein